MYLSRLTFYARHDRTQEVEEQLMTLVGWVKKAGGLRPRVMRTHYGSLGAADLIFEHEVEDAESLVSQIKKVTETSGFQQWAREVSGLLDQSSKRELYQITSPASQVIEVVAAA
jgi:hypothetical protein